MAEPTEKPESAEGCSICRTQAAGLPTPGYYHDPGCPKAQPESAPLESARRFADKMVEVIGEKPWEAAVALIEARDAAVRADAHKKLLHLLEIAWGVIANASGGDWTKETQEWRQAAAKWRDDWLAEIKSDEPLQENTE